MTPPHLWVFPDVVIRGANVSAHLVGSLHGDGEVVLSTGVPALADEHLVTDAARLPSLLGVEFSTNHLGADVPGFLRPGGEGQYLRRFSGEPEQETRPRRGQKGWNTSVPA